MMLAIAAIPVPIVIEEAMAKQKEPKISQEYQFEVKKFNKTKERANYKIISHEQHSYNFNKLAPVALKQRAYVQSRFFLSSYLEQLSL